MSIFYKKSFLITALLLLTTFCFVERGFKKSLETSIEEGIYKNTSTLGIEIIQSLNNTFGYDIHINNQNIIHQPHIPALQGNEGFKSEKDARKVAELVIKKLRKNIFPPTVSIEELDSLQIDY